MVKGTFLILIRDRKTGKPATFPEKGYIQQIDNINYAFGVYNTIQETNFDNSGNYNVHGKGKRVWIISELYTGLKVDTCRTLKEAKERCLNPDLITGLDTYMKKAGHFTEMYWDNRTKIRNEYCETENSDLIKTYYRLFGNDWR